jgi:hypothetical protein
MPLPLALLVGLVLGTTLAWVARAELARSEVPLLLARPFLVAFGLGTVVLGPVVGYFVALHGDWAYLYLVRSGRVPSALDLLFVALAALSVPLGFAVATRWAIARRSTPILQLNGVIAAVLVIVCAVVARRLSVSASFAQYHGGFGAVPIGRSPLGRGILLSWVALALAYGWSFHALRSSRRP